MKIALLELETKFEFECIYFISRFRYPSKEGNKQQIPFI